MPSAVCLGKPWPQNLYKTSVVWFGRGVLCQHQRLSIYRGHIQYHSAHNPTVYIAKTVINQFQKSNRRHWPRQRWQKPPWAKRPQWQPFLQVTMQAYNLAYQHAVSVKLNRLHLTLQVWWLLELLCSMSADRTIVLDSLSPIWTL